MEFLSGFLDRINLYMSLNALLSLSNPSPLSLSLFSLVSHYLSTILSFTYIWILDI
jgi:hypothetical protein